MSSTPWNSGVSHATHSTESGSWVSGKNVPLNRKSGLMTKRKMALKPTSFFWVAVNAMRQALNATPTSDRDRDGEHRQRRAHDPEQGEDDDEDGRQGADAERDPAELAADDAADADRGREHRLVVPAPHDLVHDRVGRLEGRGLHAHRRQQAGAEPVDVRHAAEGVRVRADERCRCRAPWRPGRGPAGGSRTPATDARGGGRRASCAARRGRRRRGRSCGVASLDERAAGEAQEDVLQARPTDERRSRSGSRAGSPARACARRWRCTAAGGRAASSIRSARPSSLPSSASRAASVKRSSSTSLVACCVDELARRALGHDLRLVHHHEVVAQLLRLVHVVGGDDERRPAALQLVEPLPEEVPRLRVEAGGRLVEDDELRLVDERAGDREAPLHAAGQRLDLVLRALVELDELEQLVGPLVGDVARDVEVARVHLEVLAHRELGVEVVDLRHDAEPRLDLARAWVRGSMPMTLSVPSVTGLAQAIIRIVLVLPAPFGPRKPNALPGRTSKSMPSTASEVVAEALRQAARMDKGGRGLGFVMGFAILDRCRRRFSSAPWSPAFLTKSVRMTSARVSAMTVRTVIQHGPKDKKVAAFAIDWPGWSRGAKDAGRRAGDARGVPRRGTGRSPWPPASGPSSTPAGELEVVEDHVGVGLDRLLGHLLRPLVLRAGADAEPTRSSAS